MTMRVLVTGASGMLGGVVARTLADRGDDVVLMQRRPSNLGLPERLGDLRDPAAVRVAVAGMDSVIHLAAKVNVVGAWDDYVAANIEGTRSLLSAAKLAGISRFVHVSSPSVAYAGHSLVGAGAGPADPAAARGFYSRSKAIAELLALAEHSVEFSAIAVRPHLVWGPGDTQLIARIIERGRTGRLALIGSGSALIDTTYVDNAADAIVAALDNADAAGGSAYVVSNGEPRPVAEILSSVCAAAGVPGPRLRVPFRTAWVVGAAVDSFWSWRGRRDDPPITRFLAEQLATAHWFDQRRTRDALHWTPQVSLDEGFARLADSFTSP